MNNTILVFDQEKSMFLSSLGFKYIFDSMNGKKVHAFLFSEELLKYVNTHFTNNDFFLNKGLKF